MNSFLLNRQLGSIPPQALSDAQHERLLQSIQATTPAVNFGLSSYDTGCNDQISLKPAHGAGINSIAVDRFEGRYLLSAGADSSIAVWDLEDESFSQEASIASPDSPVPLLSKAHIPLGHTPRSSTTASLSITHISFYPFDSLAFLTSGYDRTLKLFSSETLTASVTFDLGANIYSHATSTAASASHLLVACASNHPAVRLVDLQSGATTHSLAGHAGSVMTVAWHPRREYVLASGATDGCVRLWDIRRSASSLGVLDMEDSVGIAGYDGKGTGARRRERGRGHAGAVNGIVWTEDGHYLVSTGHDDRMRVWDMTTGANTLANFGPTLKNQHTSVQLPLLVPQHLSAPGTQHIFYPNPREILSFDMHTGTLLKRLRALAPSSQQLSESTIRNSNNRVTSLGWRAHHVEMYSGHADGSIRCWQPRTSEDVEAEDEEHPEEGNSDVESRKRKREELDRIVRDLTKRPALAS